MSTEARVCSLDLNELRYKYPIIFCRLCVHIFGPCPVFETFLALGIKVEPECRCVCVMCERD